MWHKGENLWHILHLREQSAHCKWQLWNAGNIKNVSLQISHLWASALHLQSFLPSHSGPCLSPTPPGVFSGQDSADGFRWNQDKMSYKGTLSDVNLGLTVIRCFFSRSLKVGHQWRLTRSRFWWSSQPKKYVPKWPNYCTIKHLIV